MTHHHDSTTALGTLTGTVFTVAATIDTQDYLITVILAIIGATVSFVVSMVLRWLWNVLREPQEPK
jgi:energy-coupling factor transporter transmembrane protein EcfT